MQEMRLTEPDTPINEQRVVSIARLIRYGEGSSVRELVRGAYNKIIKSESEVCIEHERIFSPTNTKSSRMVERETHEEIRYAGWQKVFPVQDCEIISTEKLCFSRTFQQVYQQLWKTQIIQSKQNVTWHLYE
jgi:hypothetical protein